VPVGTPDGEYAGYFRVRDRSEENLDAPETTGLYELRYMLNAGGRVVARYTVEVLAADAALETGASLSAPESGAPGATIEVGWSADDESADRRITLARSDQAIFTWIEAVRIEGDPPVRITLPGEAGVFELRLLDVSNQEVLARQVITVE
jgi:Ca-activated chloride channel family protein